jgi:uroporphyrin-3 C-methyltransferase
VSKKKKVAKKMAGSGSGSGSASSSTSGNNSTLSRKVSKSPDLSTTQGAEARDKELLSPAMADSVNDSGEHEQESPEQKKFEQKNHGTRGNNVMSGQLKTALGASLLALLIAAYAVYQFTLSSRITESQLAAMEERLKFAVIEQQNLEADFNRQRQQDQAKLKQVGAALADAQSLIGELKLASQMSTDEIKANLGDAVARWQLDEVHSLLTRVNRSYQLTGDQMQAVNGLMLVQSSLAVISNPRLDAVRKALAEDILRVKSDRNIDVSALHDQLSAIRSIVPDLILVEDARVMNAADSSDSENTSGEDNTGSGLFAAGKSLFSDIGSLVKHKNLDAPLQPSLDTEARFVIFESLRLTLQGAMLALLQRDNASYHAQLKIADSGLQAYFDTQQGDAKTVAEQLQVLMAFDVDLQSKTGSEALSELNRVLIVEN